MDLNYDVRGYAETTQIYLAKPGKRLLGALNGVNADTVHLDIKLQNTWELTFEVDRIVDGVYSNFYEIIDRHYELYMPNYGWFKITEVPELEGDGNTEKLSITAESLEIELQQYDLFNFEVNTAGVGSLEYLAVDNTYMEDDYKFFYDQVLFYRDTTELEQAITDFAATDGTVDDLKSFAKQNHVVFSSHRLSIDLDNFRSAVETAIAEYQAESTEEGDASAQAAEMLTNVLENNKTFDQSQALTLAETYDKVNNHMTVLVDASSDDEDVTYTGAEILDRELQRLHGLSLMHVLLHDHGWDVGFCDPYVDTTVPINNRDLPLANRIGKFDVDSQDIYSFLTQDVSQFYRCILVFDTINCKVNCFDINNVGFNTNIYLSFHNIMNSITRTSDTELYTVFNVRGDDDLNILDANFGEYWIEDISYFLNTKHFSKDFIKKYKKWQDYREFMRPKYMKMAVTYRDMSDEIDELYDRVPIDGVEPKQYSTFTNDELNEELANYKAELEGFKKFWGIDAAQGVYDGEGEDWSRLKTSDDWPNYKMIRDIIIKNIQIEITNRGLDSSEDDLDFDENYKLNFDVYGDSYGVAELEVQLKSLQDQVAALEKKYSVDDGREDTYYQEQHEQYLKYKAALDSCQRVLNIRKQQYEDAIARQEALSDKMLELKASVQKTDPQFEMTEEELKLLDKYYYYTDYENENILITDYYTNEQIVNTQKELMDDAFEELYAASHPQWIWETTQDNILLMPEFKDWHGVLLDKLSYEELRHYRYLFPELDYSDPDVYNTWRYTDLWVGNYVRVGVREDDHNKSVTTLLSDENDIALWDENKIGLFATRDTDVNHAFQVKLRITKIGLNPFLIEPTIDIEFSNMIQYKSKRNDFAQLLDMANKHSKNQIKSTIRAQSTDNTFNVDSGLIMKIINSSQFGGYMAGVTSGIVTSSLNAVSGSMTGGSLSGVVGNLVVGGIQAATIDVGQITGSRGQFEELFADYIDSEYIVTNLLEADEAYIKDLSADIIRVGKDGITEITEDTIKTANISADQITVTNAFVRDVLTVGEEGITQIASNSVTTEKVIASLVDAQQGDFDELTADSAFIEYLNSGIIEAGTVTAENVIAALVDADYGDFETLTAQTGFIEYLNSGIIDTGVITADTLIATLGRITEAQIQNLSADSAFMNYLEANLITASEIRVDDLKAKLATVDVADIDTLYANNAFTRSLQSLSSTTAQSVINQAYVINLVAGNISVADLATHSATADEIVLISQDGNPSIAFKGSTQQFYDSDGNVRVQIGQDGTGDFNFVVTGADGTTALFDYNGITRDGIPANTIVNNMINDGTIQKSKMGFPIVDTNSDGTINITSIKDGSGGNFGVSYTTFQQNVSQGMSDLSNAIEDSATYTLYIDAPYGTNIRGGNITLNARLFKNSTEVTDDWDGSYFHWTRRSQDADGDTYWNESHSTGAKTIIITANEVTISADFQCEFSADGITVISS